MKRNFFSLASMILVFTVVLFSSCSNNDSETITVEVDSSLPIGAFTVAKQGTLTAESGTPTEGTVELGTDTNNTYFLHFASNFKTETATGTVAIYLSTSEVYTADPGNGNPDLKLIGSVTSNGERYIKLNGAPAAKFTHVILWCDTANIPFGNAELQ
ncbi:DM13 domain-containing protein [Gaetbulibacter sp. M235]|uniref:DM13 domain-containing protein n=1 Tax=Gaetbulibacter sp. M235 TaxID=3126510 RepID=UPI00374FC034